MMNIERINFWQGDNLPPKRKRVKRANNNKILAGSSNINKLNNDTIGKTKGNN